MPRTSHRGALINQKIEGYMSPLFILNVGMCLNCSGFSYIERRKSLVNEAGEPI